MARENDRARQARRRGVHHGEVEEYDRVRVEAKAAKRLAAEKETARAAEVETTRVDRLFKAFVDRTLNR